MASAEEVDESSTLANLDEEIEELDVAEYEIPRVINPPTLDSILFESDEDSAAEDAIKNLGGIEIFQDFGDSTSMASSSSFDSKGRMSGRSKKSINSTHDSLLRHVILRGVSSQLMSAVERINAGKPTAMVISVWIAVGTSHGLVLIFDTKQALKWCLGTTALGEQYGSVSSLDFNLDCTRLLCGFAKGQITMWDLKNGKLLRTITDANPPATAVLHIKFTDDPTLAVCSNSGGSVFELNFKKIVTVRSCDSKCIFSGSRGEVCAFEPLHMVPLPDHPLQDVSLVALASLSKVIVISIRPVYKVLFSYALKADQKSLPLINWQFVVIQSSNGQRVIDPVLSFGRQNIINFFQVVVVSKEEISFVLLEKIEMPYLLLNFSWLNLRTLCVLDTTEHLHVIDVRTKEELEVVDLADVGLVYGSSHFKGLATGGNVSKALALAGERACYQSIGCRNGQYMLLGTRAIHVLTLRAWDERIDFLVKQHRFVEALGLSLSFYECRAKAVVGLSAKKNNKIVIGQKIFDVLMKFVDHSMLNIPDRGRPETLEEYFLDVIPVCIDYCLLLNNIDMLFNEFYDIFTVDSMAKAVFLESLESRILNEDFENIPPAIVKQFIDHYEKKRFFQELEECITHFDVATLDIHQVVTLCWNHNLYDALLYVYTQGMSDYTTPFQEMMAILQEHLKSNGNLSDSQIKLGNKMLVYISFCLAGRGYPRGIIPDEQKEMVKSEIFRIMTLLHMRGAAEDELPYPYLRTLLAFDTRELLNVLALAFEEPEFNKDTGVFHRQRLVDILLQIMVEGEGFSPSQVGALFTFLARQMAKHDNTITVNKMLFDEVLEYLTNPGEKLNRHDERQQALLDLLTAGGLKHYDEDKLLVLTTNAGFFQVCELLYMKRREYEKIVMCYLKDEPRQHETFRFIEDILSSSGPSNMEKVYVEREIFNRLDELVKLDNKRTAEVVVKCFPLKMDDAVGILEDKRKSQFHFLEGLVGLYYFNGSAELGHVLLEKYIELMCEFAPMQVAYYLRNTDGYNIDAALRIVKRHHVDDAIMFLLEKMGDIAAAFEIIYKSLKARVSDVCELSDSKQKLFYTNEDQRISLQNLLASCIEFCQRNSYKLEEMEREEMWFAILEEIVILLHLYRYTEPQAYNFFKEQTHLLFNSMMGYIKLPSIVHKMILNPSFLAGKIGDVKDVILGMLDCYNYEKILFSATTNLKKTELYNELSELQKTAKKGICSWSNSCALCTKVLQCNSQSDDVTLFRCGHLFHRSCVEKPLHFKDSSRIICVVCEQNKRCNIEQNLWQSSRERIDKEIADSPSTSGKKVSTSLVNTNQTEAWERMKKSLTTSSRLAVLTELKQNLRSSSQRIQPKSSSLLEDKFSLKLEPKRNQSATDEF